MPGLSTHYLFGIKTLRHIKELELYKLILDYPCVYALGQQGPDLLFYYPRFLRMGNIGVRMHNEGTAEFFYSMLYYIENYARAGRKKDILLVYLSGFLGHYVLDRTFHPYVYAYSMEGSGLKQQGRHFRLETEIDAYLLKTIKRTHPGFFKAGKTLALSPREEKVIIEMLQYAVFYTYGEMLGTRRLKITLCIMRLVHAFLRDKRGIKKRLITSLEIKVFGFQLLSGLIPEYRESAGSKELLNIARKGWLSPWEEKERTMSVPDMLKLARTEYVGILKELNELFGAMGRDRNDFMENVGNYSYRTGRRL